MNHITVEKEVTIYVPKIGIYKSFSSARDGLLREASAHWIRIRELNKYWEVLMDYIEQLDKLEAQHED